MLFVCHGNRLERLAAQLVARLAEPDDAPLAPRVVAVPSVGMARWLKHQVAGRLSVCAQLECPYPAQLVWRLFAAVLPGVAAQSPFERQTMAWRLFRHLERLPQGEPWRPLERWLAAGDGRARMELAQRLASLFDQYLVHRPDWLQAWGEGRRLGLGDEAELWQAALWRQLLADSGTAGLRHPKEAFFEALAADDAAHLRLPQRVAVFGVPLLPPLYLEILLRLARHLPVDLYLHNPCREFWADIVAERDLARLALHGAADLAHREVGQPLLAAWGKQARDQLALVGALADDAGIVEAEDFVVPADATLLACLQRAIVTLDDPPDGSLATDNPGSIAVHACHGLTRQLEVLHDELLARFERYPELSPGDVVVMTPDLDAAAPAIDAVFGAAPPARHIPYVVTGLRRPAGGGVLAALEALLALADSRFEVTAVLDLLETPCVARRFDLARADLEKLRVWLDEAGVRWALDGEHRHRLGLPGEVRHSWADGLARLLLGYALADGAMPVAGLPIPVAGVDGQQALTLARLLRFFAVVERFARRAAVAQPVAVWADELGQAALALVDPDEAEEQELERWRRAVAALTESAVAAGTRSAVEFAMIRERLAARLAEDSPGAVPAGAVTFCGIGPLRGLPYRVVCLTGLDAGALPRRGQPLEFDLMARRPRLGDRARHEDDRGAFLDALLAAGDAFVITYTGRDVRDNTLREPALPVTELLDWLGRKLAGGAAALAQGVWREHPLQPFSPRNFAAAAPRSFADEYLAAARVVAGGARGTAPGGIVEGAALPPAPGDGGRLARRRLEEFLRHPLRFFLQRRLNVTLTSVADELPGEEPFFLAARARWRFAGRLLERAVAGADAAELARLGAEAAELPHGVAGELALAAQLEQVMALAGRIRAVTGGERPRSLAVAAACEGALIEGIVGGLHRGVRVSWRLGRAHAGDLAVAWLDHLLLQQALGSAAPPSLLLDEARTIRLGPVAEPLAPLAALVALYRAGLERPLWLPPRTAMARLLGPDSAVRRCWVGSEHQRGECADAWFRFAAGGIQPELPAGFAAAFQAMLGPLVGRVEVEEFPR